MDTLFMLGRILFGGYFLYSGIMHFKNKEVMSGYAASKGVPMAKFLVVGTGVMLLLGGAGVLLGAYVQAALWLIVLFLLPVSFIMHAFWKETDPNAKMTQKIMFLKNMVMLGAALMMFAIPLPWPMSLF